jgi:hypothetical protein
LFGQTSRREGLEDSLKGEGIMVKVMNSGFPRMAKIVAIFMVKVIRMFSISRASQMRWEK